MISYHATVDVPDAVEDADEDAPELPADQLPDEVLIYTLPSRYCLPDVLGDEAWSRFGALPPGYRRVQAICDYVHDHLTVPLRHLQLRGAPRPTSTPPGTACAGTSPTWRSRSAGR